MFNKNKIQKLNQCTLELLASIQRKFLVKNASYLQALNIHNVYMPICETTYTQKVEHTYFIAPDTELFVQRVENGNVQLSKHLSCLFDSLCKSYTSYVSGKLQLQAKKSTLSAK